MKFAIEAVGEDLKTELRTYWTYRLLLLNAVSRRHPMLKLNYIIWYFSLKFIILLDRKGIIDF